MAPAPERRTSSRNGARYENMKMNINLIGIGKTTDENGKEDFDNEADDDDAGSGEESEGEEFEQENG